MNMNLSTVIEHLDAEQARAFVRAARHVIDALLIEAERVQAVQTPERRDYNSAELTAATPAGGWLSHEELRVTAQRLAEAIAAEKWLDGAAWALQLLRSVGGVL